MINKQIKKILGIGLSMVLALGLCACGENNKWIFSLNEEKLYEKDVAAFAYIYMADHNIRDTELFEDVYEDGKTYEEYYKQELEQDIIDTVLLYKEAKANDIKLSKEDKEQLETSVANLLQKYDEEYLKKDDVAKSDIKDVYEMKLLGENYMQSLAGNGEQEEEAEQEERYIKVYQITFPTVELDDDGMIQSGEDGKPQRIASVKASELEEQALHFVEQAQAGEDMDKLLADCDDTVTGIEKYLKYQDLELEYRKAVDGLSKGDVSGVIESNYGYYVIQLLDEDDKDYAKTISGYEEESEVVSVQEEELSRLYSEYAEANKEYKNAQLWDVVNLADYLK